jgi:hypothetical protein
MTRGHHCHATGCTVPTAREMLMCRRHWFMVPKALRARVWATYRAGQCEDMTPSHDYCEAAKAAVLAVAQLERRTADTRLYDLLLARVEA